MASAPLGVAVASATLVAGSASTSRLPDACAGAAPAPFAGSVENARTAVLAWSLLMLRSPFPSDGAPSLTPRGARRVAAFRREPIRARGTRAVLCVEDRSLRAGGPTLPGVWGAVRQSGGHGFLFGARGASGRDGEGGGDFAFAGGAACR